MSFSFRTNGNFIDFVHTDNTSLAVESTIKSLHNTSRCIDWSLPEDTTRISFTIDEVKYSNIPISDIDFDGTVMNSQDDFETGIEAMFPGLAGSPGGSSYLVYVPIITQTGVDAPIDIKLDNTIGVGTWNRDSVGVYNVTTTTTFDVAKTTILGMGSFIDSGTAAIVLTDGGSIVGYAMYYLFNDSGNLGLAIDVVDDGFVARDLVTLIGTSKLYLPEVRVYP
jgi:hypothetical protein